jgi:hypothetical protein
MECDDDEDDLTEYEPYEPSAWALDFLDDTKKAGREEIKVAICEHKYILTQLRRMI